MKNYLRLGQERLALDIIGLVESLPRSRTGDVIGGSYFVPVPLSAQIIGQHAAGNRRLMLYLSSQLLKKRLMRPSTGWSC